eukprot:scaffold1953_cov176-Amphora_coffeaeformis.AAC.28
MSPRSNLDLGNEESPISISNTLLITFSPAKWQVIRGILRPSVTIQGLGCVFLTSKYGTWHARWKQQPVHCQSETRQDESKMRKPIR